MILRSPGTATYAGYAPIPPPEPYRSVFSAPNDLKIAPDADGLVTSSIPDSLST